VPLPIIEPLQGPVNGTNRVFSASADYLPGSAQVFVNGQLKTKDLVDGWEELGGRRIRMKIAPVVHPTSIPDVLSIYYLPL